MEGFSSSPNQKAGCDDDVEIQVLGCLVDTLGTNCDQCLSMVQRCFTYEDGHLDFHTAPEL